MGRQDDRILITLKTFERLIRAHQHGGLGGYGKLARAAIEERERELRARAKERRGG